MASEKRLRDLKTALDEHTYFSLHDLKALTAESVARKQSSDVYLSVDEIQEMRRSAIKADYLSVDAMRLMAGGQGTESAYLSIHRQSQDPGYLTLEEARMDSKSNEPEYLSVEESRLLLQKRQNVDGDYLTVADIDGMHHKGAKLQNERESEYLTVNQMVAMKEIFEDAYMSVEDMNALASEARTKLYNQDTTYLSIEEMQQLAGGQIPFKALVSSVLSKQSRNTSSIGDQKLLGNIRDKLLADAISHGRHMLEGDAQFAYQLQRKEIAVAQKCERAISIAQLASLERIFGKTAAAAIEGSILARTSFTGLIKAWKKPQFVHKNAQDAPNFDKFDRQSELAAKTAAKLIDILSKGRTTEEGLVTDAFQVAAAVVQRAENGLDALGEANGMEICDGIYPCMIRMQLHSLWQSARRLVTVDEKKNHHELLKVHAHRLRFLLDRITGDSAADEVVVDSERIRQAIEEQDAVVSICAPDSVYEWPCAFCNFVNRPSFLTCEQCKATKKTAARLPQTHQMSDAEASDLYE
eukprot:m.124979 g.124979  ORF g.124979 m.124979 type:complete len:525 (+) comp17311_c0_seq2:159-1733(+)